MPRPKNNTTASSPKTKVLNHTAKQKVAPTPLLEQWAQTVCGYGDDAPAHTSAFLMILAEIEANAKDSNRIWQICWIVQKAAYAESDQAGDAMRDLVTKLRAKNGLQAVA